MFCVKCGSEKELCESLCGMCYAGEHTPVKLPLQIEITTCAHCLSRKVGNRWEDYGDLEGLIEQVVMSSLLVDSNLSIHDVEIVHRKDDEFRSTITVTVTGDVIGYETSGTATTTVYLKRGVCRRCSRIAGRYFESILQVRGEDENIGGRVKEAICRLVHGEIDRSSLKDRTSFITKEELIHTGIDFYLGRSSDGRNIAKLIAGRYSGRVKESTSQVGRKDGKDSYRMTYLVRIPRCSPGDFIKLEGRVLRVERMDPRKAVLRELGNGGSVHVARRDLKRAIVLGGMEVVTKALVVSRGQAENEVVIMHPETYQSSVVMVPDGVKTGDEGTETDVIVDGEDIYLV